MILFWKSIFTSKTYNHAVTYIHTSADDNLRFNRCNLSTLTKLAN